MPDNWAMCRLASTACAKAACRSRPRPYCGEARCVHKSVVPSLRAWSSSSIHSPQIRKYARGRGSQCRDAIVRVHLKCVFSGRVSSTGIGVWRLACRSGNGLGEGRAPDTWNFKRRTASAPAARKARSACASPQVCRFRRCARAPAPRCGAPSARWPAGAR